MQGQTESVIRNCTSVDYGGAKGGGGLELTLGVHRTHQKRSSGRSVCVSLSQFGESMGSHACANCFLAYLLLRS